MDNSITRRDFLQTILAGSALLTGGCFKKAQWPAPGSRKDSLRIVFYTDVHARTEWDTPLAVARAAHAIRAQSPDLVISGGDLITDGFESSAMEIAPRWDVYMQMHRSIGCDIYPVVGNHDLVAANPADGSPPATDPRSDFLSKMKIPRTYYSFDAAGYHFVMLDSIQIVDDPYKYQGLIWPSQREWLRQDLARIPPGTPVILASHIPLLSSFFMATRGGTFGPPKNRIVVNNVEILNLIQPYNVILVLQGHLHAQEILIRRKTTFIVGGAICGKWWRGSWHGTEEGFNVITLKGDHVTWEYVDYGWEAERPQGE